MTWPKNATKYELVKRVISQPSAGWKRLTYWQTDVKNLHFAYQLLKYAENKKYKAGEGWFLRAKGKFAEYGLLDDQFRLTQAGKRLLAFADKRIAANADYFNRRNVNPFDFEYLFHKEVSGGSKEVYSNWQEAFQAVPDLSVADVDSIQTLVRINTGKETLKNYAKLNARERKQLAEQVEVVVEELHQDGLSAARADAAPGWEDYPELLSKGALGHQNDGYYRAAALAKAHILLLVREAVKQKGGQTLSELHQPFERHISVEHLVRLFAFEPDLVERDGAYYFREAPTDERADEEAQFIEEESQEVERLRHEAEVLSPGERKKMLERILREAEKEKVLTVPKGEGRKQSTTVRHRRNPRTSAALREYRGDICQYCGYDGKAVFGIGLTEADHFLTIKDIQNNRPSNLVVLCRNCHAAKTKGVLVFKDNGEDFVVTNTFTDKTSTIPKNLF